MTPQSSREFASLLFTPRGQEEKALPDYRSPRAPSGRSPAYGRSGLRESSTPRRRSLTPTGNLHRDTAPPPPADSLLDSPAGPPAAGLNKGFELALEGRAREGTEASSSAEAEDAQKWVTVFGFQPTQQHLVIREFSKCGDILQFDSGSGGYSCNWIHLRYANKYQAQRALQRSGELLDRGLMVGVRCTDPRQQPVKASSGAPQASALPQPLPVRPYSLEAGSRQALPHSSRSSWDRISEFVFGL